jgi:hypothetical protein
MAQQFVKLADGSFVKAEVMSQREVADIQRQPQVLGALKVLVKDADTAAWLLEKKEEILTALDSGASRRVTKQERKALKAALDKVESGFLKDNADAIVESFKWPLVKRVAEEEQTAIVLGNLNVLTGDNADMSAWLVANKDSLVLAYDAGLVKRVVPASTTAALDEYRAAKAAGPEALAAYTAKKAAEKAAKAAAAKA